MARTGSIAIDRLAALLKAPEGLALSAGNIAQIAMFTLPPIDNAFIYDRNVPAEIAEKILGAKYPAIYIYCEKITNSQIEKFRTFSGTVDLQMEIRVSDDHVDGLQTSLQHYVDVITDVLDRNRGSWLDGFYYAGGYEVTFQPVKKGGKCYLQIAKVRVQMNISVS